MKKSDKPYVVYVCEHLRDGIEEYAKIVMSEEAALAWISRHANAGCNYTFRLFRLGEEIPLRSMQVTEPQPAKVKTTYEVAK